MLHLDLYLAVKRDSTHLYVGCTLLFMVVLNISFLSLQIHTHLYYKSE